MTALFEVDELRAGDGVGDVPGDERRDVHVEAAVDDEGGEAEVWECGGEVESHDGFADGFADGGVEAEIGDAREVAGAELLAVEDHTEVSAEASVRALLRIGEPCSLLLLAGDHVGEDAVEVALHDAEVGGGGVGKDELVDVLGVGSGVGHGEEAAVGVTDEVDLGEVEVSADGFEVGDLSVDGLRGMGGDAGGFAEAALVVEDDLPIAGEALPDVVLEHVDVGEAGAAVDGDDSGCGGGCAVDLVGEVDVWRVRDAGAEGDELRLGRGGLEDKDHG